jgi:hypothetical protein
MVIFSFVLTKGVSLSRLSRNFYQMADEIADSDEKPFEAETGRGWLEAK